MSASQNKPNENTGLSSTTWITLAAAAVLLIVGILANAMGWVSVTR
jgi:hypothetical protein